MFRFEKRQQIFDICGTKIGGQPGELPTVMMGSIFYRGDKIVHDEERGIFDRQKAEELLSKENEMSDLYGNPRIVDVVGAWPEALIRYMDFIADVTDSPFLIDGPTAEVRAAGLRYAEEAGLVRRAIYNSINAETTLDEIKAIRQAKIRSLVALMFNSRKPTIQGRMDLIDGTNGKTGLLDLAKQSEAENILLDTTVIDTIDPGIASKAIYRVKERTGLPAGCGPHNAINIWHRRKKLTQKTYEISSVVASIFPILMGGNFLLYGPISTAQEMYHVCALADAYVSYCVSQEFDVHPQTKHPLSVIFSHPTQL